MHNVMFGPIGTESCGMLEVKHWITAPDIEVLAVAMAVLEKLVTGPSTTVIFWNINRLQSPDIETGGRWLIRESQGIVGELMVQYVTPVLSSKSRLQVSEIWSPTHAKSWPLMWSGLDSSALIPMEAQLYSVKRKYLDTMFNEPGELCSWRNNTAAVQYLSCWKRIKWALYYGTLYEWLVVLATATKQPLSTCTEIHKAGYWPPVLL